MTGPLASDLHVGVGLWAMRSTARAPKGWTDLYSDAVDAAVAVERLGLDSIWVSEHRFWYDGWCPQPLLVCAAMAAVTDRLHVGTAMHLPGQHDQDREASAVSTLAQQFPGRLELGVALGYRQEEISGMGLDPRRRVERLEAAVDRFRSETPGLALWMGGTADAVLRRAVRTGASLLLPGTTDVTWLAHKVARVKSIASEMGLKPPRVGVLASVWAGNDPVAARHRHRASLHHHTAEFTIAWLGHDTTRSGMSSSQSTLGAGVAGSASEVSEHLGSLIEAGADSLVLQIHNEETREESLEQLGYLVERVLPSIGWRP